MLSAAQSLTPTHAPLTTRCEHGARLVIMSIGTPCETHDCSYREFNL